MNTRIIAVCAPHPRRENGTRCESDRAAFIVRRDQQHLVTCPWCLGARTNIEAIKIVEQIYATPPVDRPIRSPSEQYIRARAAYKVWASGAARGFTIHHTQANPRRR